MYQNLAPSGPNDPYWTSKGSTTHFFWSLLHSKFSPARYRPIGVGLGCNRIVQELPTLVRNAGHQNMWQTIVHYVMHLLSIWLCSFHTHTCSFTPIQNSLLVQCYFLSLYACKDNSKRNLMTKQDLACLLFVSLQYLCIISIINKLDTCVLMLQQCFCGANASFHKP